MKRKSWMAMLMVIALCCTAVAFGSDTEATSPPALG